MILDHQTLSLYGYPLFTWVTMTTPMEASMPIPSDACFVYVKDGDGQLLAESVDLKAEPGHMIVSLCGYTVGRMMAGQVAEEGQVSTVIIHFNRETLLRIYEQSKPPGWQDLDTPVVRYLVHESASELIKVYCEGLTNLFKNGHAVTEEILELKLKEIVLLLLQSWASDDVRKIIRGLFSQRTFDFKEIIEANVCEPFSLERMAGMTGHSLTSFKSEFKRVYGTTPGAYIMERRVEKVADLLKTSDLNVSEVGYKCGFNSPAHLSRAFREKYGVAPSEYRRNFTEVPIG